jgi:hypothetical protein
MAAAAAGTVVAEAASAFDWQAMAAQDGRQFRATRPYPWLNAHGLLRDAAYRELVATLPDVGRFEKSFEVPRKHGQRPHNRYALEWQPGLELAAPWQTFVDELRGSRYRDWLAGMLGTRWFRLHFHWHYAPPGGEVSPHCDSRLKLGSHIFYLNTAADWRQEWGGETLVLDDGGRLRADSAPDFEDFDAVHAARTLENYSLLFSRRGDSWHGVRPVQCPEGHMRRVFIVVIDDDSPLLRLRRLVKGRAPRGY